MRTPISLVSLAAAAVGLAGLASTGGAASAADNDGAVAALTSSPAIARAATGQGFVERGTIVDADGTTHTRMDRTFGGLPVIGGDLVVHQAPDGTLESASQTLAAPLTLSVKPVVTAAKAATTALAPSAVTNAITGDSEVKARTLVVDATGATPRLAWQVVTGGVQEDGTPSRLATYVDARSGQVLRTEQQIVNVDGQGQSLYSGTVPLQVTQSGSAYTLKDGTRGGTYTTDVNGATDSPLCQILQIGCKAGTTFSSPDTSFGSGTNANRESAGVDAQYGTNVTWDYYKFVHGRNGIFGNGTGSFNRVHYGQNYVNAFWDGTKMTYGDGDGVNYGPLVSLDVTGHEMSHGVTENTAGLTYSGESGGLNEATSDIFGTMVEFSANNANDPGDYLIGEEFDLKNHAGFRRMDNPIADGSSPNCWSSNTKNLDVHYSSGVGNHFFYLLAEGSGAKTIGGVAHSSPTCNGSTVTGIGRDAAAKIWYRALTVYMTSGTTYAQARTASLNAAKDLYGAGSTQQNAVAAAWSAVSVS
ncbi:M4 family metallopeptidase [Nocardioides currus]|uniref:Neutral metalloproteinase n=1 Tax=Nocardioides currus TaxID=2133958 RepID=A0A2R7YW66_9ACTN|nr:M4 family metallopeptidase [Nocardioides currus]PUA80657.1 peptidase M4 family protein [Nocardioides currus]